MLWCAVVSCGVAMVCCGVAMVCCGVAMVCCGVVWLGVCYCGTLFGTMV